ncbi:F-box/kelch-repeat protein-like [Dorcoceras hygrometricum]|uniref:F-box/kelch-repeat protein-like n=1 Tax=Dorcoceras hygrometricum TaxID=472368 RepID=A0A2Z7CTN6_9LAMI|nr:F-box/kelch-repeat protein-like [Dorcoceras hygrometricum]
MINSPDFVHHHLRNSTSGVIIQKGGIVDHRGIYVEMRGGSLEIHEFDFGFSGLVWSSCNGLVLASEFTNDHTHSVVNPVTKQQVFLPPYSSDIGNHGHFALAFVEATMEYKVACMIGIAPLFERTHIAVLTVGVDKVWRYIDIKHLHLETRLASFSVKPIVTGGYVHWISRSFVLTINMENETIRSFLCLDFAQNVE